MEDNIIYRAQMGDQAAFQQLVEMYNTVAWRTAQLLLPERATVEDVMQEAWLDVWRGLPRFQRDRQFRPWLLTIVANRCRMAARRKVPVMMLDIADADQLVRADDVLEHILRLEEDTELQLALTGLSAEQRRVLELRFYADLDLSEIALITNAPVGTVKSRLHRALNSLRTHLQSLKSPCSAPIRSVGTKIARAPLKRLCPTIWKSSLSAVGAINRPLPSGRHAATKCG